VQGSGEEATFGYEQLTELLTLARKGIATLIDAQRAVLASLTAPPS
jgi:ribonuclease PH